MNTIKPSQIIGGAMGWLDEVGFETEISPQSVVKAVTNSLFESLMDLGQDVAGAENKEKKQIAPKGTIEFNKAQTKAQEEENKKKAASKDSRFYQAFKEDQYRAESAKNRLLLEEEINDIATNLSTDEKNELLHYQASYRDRSIYQRAELRRKIIERRNNAQKQEKTASIPSPAKQASALQTAFEGGSGSQGGGTANLSAHATG